MKPTKVLQVMTVAGAVAACLAGLVACSSVGSKAIGGAAATVNGVEISEQTVTDYIEGFRSAQGLDTEEAWGTWLATYGSTPESVREEVINTYVDEELTKQAAEENGVSVTDEEVDEQIQLMKANYGSDEAWESALSAAGTTEDQYRDSVRNAMLEQRLQEQVVSDVEGPSDEEMLSYAQLYAPAFNGAKRSSHILFASGDEATAQKVLDQINNGEISFEDAAKQYSTDTASAENGGDVGWDLLNSFVTEYTDGLSELDEGQVSGLVVSEFGIHIIKCTEVFTAPEEITSTDQVPSELLDYISDMVMSSNTSSAYSEWWEKYKEGADIVINDMPEGLPYAIDMSAYATEETATEEADAQGEVEAETDAAESDDATADAETTEDGAAQSDDAATAEGEGATDEGAAAEDAATEETSGTTN